MNCDGTSFAAPNLRLRLHDRLAFFLVRRRWLLLSLGLIVFGASAVFAGRLQFDRSLERLFRPDDPDLVALRQMRRIFSAGDIIFVTYRDGGLLAKDASGLKRLRDIVASFRAIPGVYDVWSLDQPIGDEIVHPESDMARRMRHLFEGYTHNHRGDVSSLSVLLFPGGAGQTSREQTVAEIRRLAARLPGTMLAGEPVLTAEGFRFIADDGVRLGWVSTALLAAVILLVTGRPRFVLVPLGVVQVAVVGTQASLVLLELHASWVSSVLTAVITVVGIGTVMHVLVRFQEKARLLGDEEQALVATLTELIRPMFWVLVTDAIGFGALSISQVLPIREFAAMMVLGVAWVGLAAVLLVPALVLFPVPRLRPARLRPLYGNNSRWGGILDRGLHGLLHGAIRYRGISGTLVLLVAGGGLLGWSRLRVETDFTRNFRQQSEVAQAYRFIENELGGAGVWDILLPAPEKLDWPYLQRIQRLEDRLRREVVVSWEGRLTPGLTKVLSLIDAVDAASPQPLAEVRYDWLREGMIGLGMNLIRHRMPSLFESLYGSDPTTSPPEFWYRIMLRSRERVPTEVKQRIVAGVRRICAEEFPRQTEVAVRRSPVVGGYYVLLARLVESVLEDQGKSLALVMVGILLTMLVISRSIVTALLSLLANLLPVAAVLGVLGWLGISANMGSAMMAAVSLGLSVDGTIHYLAVRDAALRAGRSRGESLLAAQTVVGPATILATLALTLGFATMILSEFIPTVHFGVLLSLTMLGGMISNLFVLPWMLMVFDQFARSVRKDAGYCGELRQGGASASGSNISEVPEPAEPACEGGQKSLSDPVRSAGPLDP